MSDVMVVVQRFFEVERLNDDDSVSLETLHERAEAVMAQLVELSESGAILDASVSSESDRGVVSIEVTTRASDLDAGVASAVSAMRAAIHAVGDSTPGWPSHKDVMRATAQAMQAEVVEPVG